MIYKSCGKCGKVVRSDVPMENVYINNGQLTNGSKLNLNSFEICQSCYEKINKDSNEAMLLNE